jgi:hypothetical protein
MIGFVLDAIDDVVVFTTLDDPSRWFDFYVKRFPGCEKRIRNVSEYEPGEWDMTILLTDDDWAMRVGAIPDEKMLCIEHFHRLRRPGSEALGRLATRRFADRPELEWCIPTYNLFSARAGPKGQREAAKASPKSITPSVQLPDASACRTQAQVKASDTNQNTRIVVTCIGDASNLVVPPQTFADVVSRRFSNTDDIQFHVFRRHVKTELAGLGIDLVDHVNESSVDLINHLQTSDYVMIMTGHQLEESHCRHFMSGAIPLAYATGCRLIMTSDMKREYALESPLVVESDAYFELSRPNVCDIESVYEEAGGLIARRDDLLSKYLRYQKNARTQVI